MALPKHKVSKSRRGMRRSHKKTAAPNVVACPQCGEKRLPHHVCPACGNYDGRSVTEGSES